MLSLILRSPDRGNGWRTVSQVVWDGLIVPFQHKQLLELDEDNRQVRLSRKGEVVAEYL